MAGTFERLERLGSGHFGEVWLARDTGLDTLRALKIIPVDRLIDQNNFFREAQTLKAAEHANVVRVEETGLTAEGSIYVAMEYLEGRSLENEAKGSYIPLSRLKRVMVDMLRGLAHAHHKGILHRDIKPANILVGPSGEGKLSDFGLALPLGVNPAKLGIKDYKYVLHLAPEVAAGGEYEIASDVYASGVTMYRLVNGDSFFTVPAGADLLNMTMKGTFPDRSLYRDFVPLPWRKLINKAMHPDPKQRFCSSEEMRHAVERMKARINWHEKRLNNGWQWTSSHKLICTKVILKQVSGCWIIEVKRGRSKAKLRRVGHFCSSANSLSVARRRAQKILQNCVLGKTEV